MNIMISHAFANSLGPIRVLVFFLLIFAKNLGLVFPVHYIFNHHPEIHLNEVTLTPNACGNAHPKISKIKFQTAENEYFKHKAIFPNF